MVNVYIGNNYKLTFPILCNGYLNINYDETVTHPSAAIESSGVLVDGNIGSNSTKTITVDTVDATTKFSVGDTLYSNFGTAIGIVDAVTSTSITLVANNAGALNNNENLKKNITTTKVLRDRPLWNHKDSFTLEAIVTPYDVNGLANRTTGYGVLDSTKTPPYPNNSLSNRLTTYESVSIMAAGSNAYKEQKMMLFYNTNLKFYLQNTTGTGGSSFNQPAEYKLVIEITSGGVTKTISSDVVISATSTLHNYYDENGYYINNTTSFTKLSSNAGIQIDVDSEDANITLQDGEADALVGKGTKIYDSNLNLIGEALSVTAQGDDSDLVVLKEDRLTNVTSTVYVSQLKEALYLEQTYKFSLVYLKGGSIELYVNNELVAKEKITLDVFQLNESDCQIGRGTTGQEQFYGELYEIIYAKTTTPSPNIHTLTTGYSDTLFYYTFGG
mgnify:CR=1 FL=1|tara:strand:- start:3184 stop:4512 length:1329 start_codon:yes stop_codon:yes gene_type:complete